MLRCSAGDPDRSGALVRVPSAAYQLLYVVEPAELSRRQAEAALERLRTQALDVVDLEALVAADALAGDELAQARDTIEAIPAAVDGRAPAPTACSARTRARARRRRRPAAGQRRPRDRAHRGSASGSTRSRILRQRGDNLARATGTPYRVFAVLVTDPARC
ncbi:MAG: hypothetical protein IPL61_32240 [Myxococcales bacterium]|nr:hypothetical protein [Myxococcales bacterium]